MARKEPDIAHDTYLTTHEVGAFLQCNPSSINKWAKEDRIPCFRTPGGHRRIKVADLIAFLREYKMPIPKALDVDVPRLDVTDQVFNFTFPAPTRMPANLFMDKIKTQSKAKGKAKAKKR